MNQKRSLRTLVGSAALLLAPLLTAGCHIVMGTADGPKRLELTGAGTIYATHQAWRRWNGNVVEFGAFGGTERKGEFLSLDVWPLFGVGVGAIGARVRVLPIEIGFGTLFYEPLPLPAGYGWNEPKETAKPDSSDGSDLGFDKGYRAH